LIETGLLNLSQIEFGDRTMSDSPSKVFFFDASDPQMQQANERARSTFRYFWRELSWERRRIVPALDLAAVKAPFTDGQLGDDSPVQQMWISEVNFNGREVGGVLLNSPNDLSSVSKGDAVRIPLGHLTDWMFAISGEVFGAFTVNLMRSRMSKRERQEHDSAWGLDFGDPARGRVTPEPNKGGGLLKGWFGNKAPADDEHPMSAGMTEKLSEQIKQGPSLLKSRDERGWTFLHQEALAGNLATVKVLLEAGADRHSKTADGMTPRQLAESLGWEKVAALLPR
jgi:uncharacterized protein YegJ (DUF2314 family)